MGRRKSSYILPIILAVLFILSVGCKKKAEQKPSGPLEKVSIAYTSNSTSLLIHIALKKGFFREEGLEVSPMMYSVGKAALNAVLEGKADIGAATETPTMFAITKGSKIYITAIIETSNNNEQIVARKDHGIVTPADLKGRKIGVALGTAAEFYLDSFLASKGINKKGVRIINSKPDEAVNSLLEGKLDAVAVWHPYVAIMKKKLAEKATIFRDEKIYTENFCVIAKDTFVRERPDAIKKVLRALIKAEEFVKNRPAESVDILAELMGTDLILAKEIMDIHDYRVTLDQSLIISIEDQTRWAVKNGLTDKVSTPNYIEYIYFDGLNSVRPESVRIIR
jgi:sulfonate transport system substrate-binding protein